MSQFWNPFASFTRPADTTTYSIGDLVANTTGAAGVSPMQVVLGNQFPIGMTRITRCRLSKTSTVTTNANFRVHLYEASPTFANGDNGAWSSNKAVNWLGSLDVATMLAFTDGCTGFGGATAGSEMFLRLASGSTVYAVLEAKSAYVPASAEVFTLVLEDVAEY